MLMQDTLKSFYAFQFASAIFTIFHDYVRPSLTKDMRGARTFQRFDLLRTTSRNFHSQIMMQQDGYLIKHFFFRRKMSETYILYTFIQLANWFIAFPDLSSTSYL
jgi:hypothetical protein